MSTLELPERREGRPAPDDLVARRDGIAAAAAHAQVPEGIAVEHTNIGGVECVVCAPPDPIADVLYFHGGGYRLGTAAAWTSLAGQIAARANARVLVVEYGLAPEDPFPAALHDAAAVYAALTGASSRPVLLAGDSAGGGLATSLALALASSGRTGGDAPGAAGVVLLSPWLDLTVSAGSYSTNAGSDQLFSAESAGEAAELYLQGHDARDPLASPLFGDLSGLPPALVLASAHEVLVDDACALASALGAAGVRVELHLVPEMPHVWPFMMPDHAASNDALDDIARFVQRAVAAT